jgi:DNA polymerase IV
MDARTIVHLDLDTFFVSVERLMNSELVGKPVIVGGTSDRGVVASCSYEARQFGVHAAMPMKLARQLCPQATYVRGDMDTYSKYSGMVTDIIGELAPVYEKASIDEHYLDISGMDKFVGCLKWTKELRQRVMKETGLPISFGLSANKTVSKIATGEAKPNGEKEVQRGLEKSFLAPLSIRKIPMVGDKTYYLLRNMGIEKVKTVQEMSPDLLYHALGENGIGIWKKANGIDNNPVEPYTERKSISTESTFENDTIDIDFLQNTLVSMVEQLAFQMRSEKKLTACITVKVRYSNFDTHSAQARISYTSSDHTLISKARELFKKVYDRRMLVRLVGVKFSYLVNGSHQINLFEDTTELINLYQAMDRVRLRYGESAVIRSVGMKAANG